MNEPSPKKIAGWIFLAIAIWGTVLSIGAVMYGINPSTGEIGRETNFQHGLLRGGILFCFVFTFLGLWWLMLRRRDSQAKN